MSFKFSKLNLTVAVVFIQNIFIVVCGQLQDDVLIRNTYTKQLLKQFGNGTAITVKDLEDFYYTRKIVWNRNQQPDDIVNNCFAAGSTRNLELQESCLLKTVIADRGFLKPLPKICNYMFLWYTVFLTVDTVPVFINIILELKKCRIYQHFSAW